MHVHTMGIIGLGLVGLAITGALALHQVETSLPVPEALKAEVYFDIGQYYFNHDGTSADAYNLVLAREYYDQAVALDPKVDEALWYQFGRLEFIEGNLDAALEKFEKQLDYFGEELPNVQYMKGLTYGYKARRTNDPADWRQAELAFINFLPYAPTSPWTRVDLAWVYFSQGKYEEMKPVLEEGMSYRSNNAWLLNMYGLALLNTGDAQGALENFVKAQNAAFDLTEADWGESYPGNHPDLWGAGLAEFRMVIAKNIKLALSSTQ